MEYRISMSKTDLNHLIGKKVGSYTLLKEIGRGGNAAVFVAFQSSLKRQIALKILPKSLINPQTAQLFHQEAELAAILSHPNIISIYEVGEEEDFLFIAMQLVKGKALSHYISKARKNPIPSKRVLSLKTVISITMSVLDAMDYAHSEKIIHRDIKPANILIENHLKRPLIVDFGLARVSTNQYDSSLKFVGSPKYMSPEQILYPKVDGRADIYATGIMMLEMLSYKPLFPGLTSIKQLIKFKLKQKEYLFDKKPSEMNPLLNEEMDRILSKVITYDPDKRYDTCHDFKKDLERYQNEYLEK